MAKGPGTVLPLPDVVPERLTGGYKNELWRYGDVVLRLTRAPLASVEWELELLRTLRLPEVVVPVAGPATWPDGRTALVLPYVAGDYLEDAEQMAAFVADLHRCTWAGGQRPGAVSWAERNLDVNDWWDWRIVEKPPELVRAYEEMAAFLADPPRFRLGVVHGDVHPRNTRARDGRLVGVIDWDDARLDWQAWELANAAWVFGPAFVDAYVDAGGPAETDHLDELVRFRNVADVLYSSTSKARGEPYSQEHIDHLLRCFA
jgi:Ser/Thr protein kinase RdoA (MazF antagonist)